MRAWSVLAPFALSACASLSGLSVEPVPTDGGLAGDSGVPSPDARDDGATVSSDATCAADLANDARNCGACGHDCQGGACQFSACVPTLLATTSGTPTGLAVDATRVYWVASGDIYACATGGCASAEVLVANEPAQPKFLDVDGSRLFWTTVGLMNTTVRTCQLPACSSPTTFRAGVNFAGEVHARAGTVFFTDASSTGAIYSCSGTSCASPLTVVAAQGYPRSLVVDKGQVFFVTGQSGGEVSQCAATGCAAPTTPAPGLNYPRSVAVGESRIYFIVDEGLRSCPRIGCSSGTQELIGMPGLGEAFIDGPWVYATSATAIFRCGLGGCGLSGPTSFAGARFKPQFLRSDATWLYWTDTESLTTGALTTRVYRVAK